MDFMNQLRIKAVIIKQESGCSFSLAMEKASLAFNLIEKLHAGNVTFQYQKEDGTLREAEGTLCNYEYCFKRPYKPRHNTSFVVYYDVQRQAWRACKAANLIQICTPEHAVQPKSDLLP